MDMSLERNQLLRELVNKQFKMIKVDVEYDKLPTDGMIEIVEGKKKIKKKWYEHYKFENEEQYLEWKEWAMKKMDDEANKFNELDMVFGLDFKRNIEGIKKEGQLELF